MKILNMLLAAAGQLLCLAAAAQNTVIAGQLKGLGNATVKIFYMEDGVSKSDSATVANDLFSWNTNLTGPVRIALTVGKNNFFFFAEPGLITIRGIKDSVPGYRLEGSPMQEDANMYTIQNRDITKKRDSLFSKLNTASEQEKTAINNMREALGKESDRRVEQFIAAHPESHFSVYLVSVEREFNRIKQLYDLLGESAKQSSKGIKIGRKIDILTRTTVGNQLADFTQPDTTGHLVHFRNFKGKWVLVDFWASWCVPCRAENPNVLNAFQAFKDKGFTVVGVSLDTDGAAWKKAILKDKLPWTQLSDLKGAKNAVATAFGIELIPSNFLVDPSGRIVAKNLRGEDLQNTLKKLLH